MPMSTSLSSSSEVLSHSFVWNMFLCHLILSKLLLIFVCCCCSVTQSCLTLCNPMDYRISDFPVLHHLLEFAQTHVPWVGDAIQPSLLCHPLSSCPQSLLASESFPMSWLFTSGGQSIGASASASVLPTNIQGWFPLGLTSLQPLALSLLFGAVNVRI